MKLSVVQRDRAAGVLLGQACGDALGVPYEFAPPPKGDAVMKGGGLGPYEPGEWSDDTQMAACIAQVSDTGVDLTTPEALDGIASGFVAWRREGASDIGNQTRAVLRGVQAGDGAGKRLTEAAAGYAERHTQSAGNGALMRNGVVGLTRLDDRQATASAAQAVAQLTHADALAVDSCILHAEAVRYAVTTGVLDLTAGLDLVDGARRHKWATWLKEAKTGDPASFGRNGFTVTALQAAWAAIVSTDDGTGDPRHLQRALHAAVRIGHDTDTVAAIAGALLGARYGVSAVPAGWRRVIHGWPGLRSRDLIGLAYCTAVKGADPAWDDAANWPHRSSMREGGVRPIGRALTSDEGVILGTEADLERREELGFDAVVSLSRLGPDDLDAAGVAPGDHVECWLVDSDDPRDNADLGFALEDAADAVAALRSDGRRVLLHCVAAHHRTPSVALVYAVRHLGLDVDRAAREIHQVLGVGHVDGLLWSTARSVAAAAKDAVVRPENGVDPRGRTKGHLAE